MLIFNNEEIEQLKILKSQGYKWLAKDKEPYSFSISTAKSKITKNINTGDWGDDKYTHTIIFADKSIFKQLSFEDSEPIDLSKF